MYTLAHTHAHAHVHIHLYTHTGTLTLTSTCIHNQKPKNTNEPNDALSVASQSHFEA